MVSVCKDSYTIICRNSSGYWILLPSLWILFLTCLTGQVRFLGFQITRTVVNPGHQKFLQSSENDSWSSTSYMPKMASCKTDFLCTLFSVIFDDWLINDWLISPGMSLRAGCRLISPAERFVKILEMHMSKTAGLNNQKACLSFS